MNPAVRKAIASIAEDAWTPIHYPNAFVDTDTGLLVSDAEVAEVPVFTAFGSTGKTKEVTGRLVRAHLIAVPAPLARSARALRLHLPRDWPWRHSWTGLFDTAHAPPAAA